VAILFLGQPDAKAGGAVPGYQIVHEAGKVRLLEPGEPESRLENNRRLKRLVDDVASRVRKEGR
jgi:hypothetical protein